MIKVTIEIKRERPFRIPVKNLCEKYRFQFFQEVVDEEIQRFHTMKIKCEFRNLIEHMEFLTELDKIINY